MLVVTRYIIEVRCIHKSYDSLDNSEAKAKYKVIANSTQYF